ncbi:MAG: SPOR domain-containing protein [Thermodesulfobacteriota bacterium]
MIFRIINLGLISLLLVIGSDSYAQTDVTAKAETGDGVHVITFVTGQGKIELYLPDDLMVGEVISGTIRVTPSGFSDEDIQRNNELLLENSIRFSNTDFSVSAERITVEVPSPAAGDVANIILKDRHGIQVAATVVPVKVIKRKFVILSKPGPEDFSLPKVGQAGRLVTASGPFDGYISNTKVRFAGQEIKVLAESSNKIVFESPSNIIGATEVQIIEGNVFLKRELTNLAVVKLNIESNNMPDQGDTTEISIVDEEEIISQEIESAIDLSQVAVEGDMGIGDSANEIVEKTIQTESVEIENFVPSESTVVTVEIPPQEVEISDKDIIIVLNEQLESSVTLSNAQRITGSRYIPVREHTSEGIQKGIGYKSQYTDSAEEIETTDKDIIIALNEQLESSVTLSNAPNITESQYVAEMEQVIEASQKNIGYKSQTPESVQQIGITDKDIIIALNQQLESSVTHLNSQSITDTLFVPVSEHISEGSLTNERYKSQAPDYVEENKSSSANDALEGTNETGLEEIDSPGLGKSKEANIEILNQEVDNHDKDIVIALNEQLESPVTHSYVADNKETQFVTERGQAIDVTHKGIEYEAQSHKDVVEDKRSSDVHAENKNGSMNEESVEVEEVIKENDNLINQEVIDENIAEDIIETDSHNIELYEDKEISDVKLGNTESQIKSKPELNSGLKEDPDNVMDKNQEPDPSAIIEKTPEDLKGISDKRVTVIKDIEEKVKKGSETAPIVEHENVAEIIPNQVSELASTDDFDSKIDNVGSKVISPDEKESSVDQYTVQVASFRNRIEANRLTASLIAKDYDAYVMVSDLGEKGIWYRVRIGRFDSEDEAAIYGEELKLSEPLITSTFVSEVAQ